MTTTLSNQQSRINLANGGLSNREPMQNAQVVTLKSGQQNASLADSRSRVHSYEVRTSSTLPRCSRVKSKPEVIGVRGPMLQNRDSLTPLGCVVASLEIGNFTSPVTAAGSEGRCNTIQCVESAMPAQGAICLAVLGRNPARAAYRMI